jgi:hypothetical protein
MQWLLLMPYAIETQQLVVSLLSYNQSVDQEFQNQYPLTYRLTEKNMTVKFVLVAA